MPSTVFSRSAKAAELAWASTPEFLAMSFGFTCPEKSAETGDGIGNESASASEYRLALENQLLSALPKPNDNIVEDVPGLSGAGMTALTAGKDIRTAGRSGGEGLRGGATYSCTV